MPMGFEGVDPVATEGGGDFIFKFENDRGGDVMYNTSRSLK
jgi:hypothetical protein